MHTLCWVIKHFPQNKATKERLKIENSKTPKMEHFWEISPYEHAKIQFEWDGIKPMYPTQYLKRNQMKYEPFIGRNGRVLVRRGIDPEPFNPYFESENAKPNPLDWDYERSSLYKQKASQYKRLHSEIDEDIDGDPTKNSYFSHDDLSCYFFDRMAADYQEPSGFVPETYQREIKKKFEDLWKQKLKMGTIKADEYDN